MQRLKKVWNYWMNLDTSKRFHDLPDKILPAFLGTAYVLLTIGLFWASYNSFDLRHPMIGKNYYYEADWERILGGCLELGTGSVLVGFGIRGIWSVRVGPEARSLENRATQPYQRGKKRFKPNKRRNRQ